MMNMHSPDTLNEGAIIISKRINEMFPSAVPHALEGKAIDETQFGLTMIQASNITSKYNRYDTISQIIFFSIALLPIPLTIFAIIFICLYGSSVTITIALGIIIPFQVTSTLLAFGLYISLRHYYIPKKLEQHMTRHLNRKNKEIYNKVGLNLQFSTRKPTSDEPIVVHQIHILPYNEAENTDSVLELGDLSVEKYNLLDHQEKPLNPSQVVSPPGNRNNKM
ncbi:SWI/SNF-related regulator of chromatin [Acrasis kona]|uniref:SWI/SNF-related regulator of chromatin n=1 Tax=Acrasis kona TaxID=1008807 RepID=A0AAW2ZM28_9EUKA